MSAASNGGDGTSSAALYASIVGDVGERPAVTHGPGYFCAECNRRVDEATRASHEASLEHTLSLKLPSRCRRVVLPDGNKGAQMLAKLGWRDDGVCGGLGKERQGRVAPIPTVLKRDTSGLGVNTYQARVTHPMHVPPKPEPVAPSTAAQRGDDAKRAAALRREFRDDDVPEEFISLFNDQPDHAHTKKKKRRTSRR